MMLHASNWVMSYFDKQFKKQHSTNKLLLSGRMDKALGLHSIKRTEISLLLSKFLNDYCTSEVEMAVVLKNGRHLEISSGQRFFSKPIWEYPCQV